MVTIQSDNVGRPILAAAAFLGGSLSSAAGRIARPPYTFNSLRTRMHFDGAGELAGRSAVVDESRLPKDPLYVVLSAVAVIATAAGSFAVLPIRAESRRGSPLLTQFSSRAQTEHGASELSAADWRHAVLHTMNRLPRSPEREQWTERTVCAPTVHGKIPVQS